jgi:dolichol-phosphate mannosyltransferase
VPSATKPNLPAAGPLVARVPAALSQFARFGLVGAGGYAVNLVTFALLVDRAGVDYRPAGALAFLVAVTNNFAWNRRWTFRATGPGAVRQAGRFLVVSVLAAATSLVLLTGLVGLLHVEAVAAQAVATIAVTPLSFIGNRRWTFAGPPPRPLPRFERVAPGRCQVEMPVEPTRYP